LVYSNAFFVQLIQMKIYLKSRYVVSGELESRIAQELQFRIPMQNNGEAIVKISLDGKQIESFCEAEISNDLYNILKTGIKEVDGLSNSLQVELAGLRCPFKAAQKVFSLIKYCFNNIKLDEGLLGNKGNYWSEDKLDWKYLPGKIIFKFDAYSTRPLTEDNARAIQDYIDSNFEPFLAFRHLHRAIRERSPRYKWIDATIAAELAIKEFFIRLNKDIEPWVLEVPSPPLDKLYGKILEFYTGERSPKVNAIREGAKIRNELLHKPQDNKIEYQRAVEYVKDVEIAIWHLIKLLYKDNRFIENSYIRRI